jgi:hypothetical protein
VSIAAASPFRTRARRARSRNSASATPSSGDHEPARRLVPPPVVLRGAEEQLVHRGRAVGVGHVAQRARDGERVAALVGEQPLPERDREPRREEPSRGRASVGADVAAVGTLVADLEVGARTGVGTLSAALM